MKILIAEDDPTSRLLLRTLLAGEKRHEIAEVGDGGQAWEWLGRGEPCDLAILDVMMPEMDGLQVLASLRKDPRTAALPVILCTALSDRQTVKRAAGLAVTRYLVKPYQKEIVLGEVRKIEEMLAGGVLDDSAPRLAQLGLDAEQHRQCVVQLCQETESRLEEVARALGDPERESLKGRLIVLKTRGARLGATPLTLQIDSLLAVLSRTGDTAEPSAGLGVSPARGRAEEIQGALQRIAFETNRLRQWLANASPPRPVEAVSS